MTCHQFSAKLLFEPLLGYCQLDPHEQTSVNFQSKYKTFVYENESENIVCEMAAILSRGDELTHSGLVTPYGDKDLGPHWLR